MATRLFRYKRGLTVLEASYDPKLQDKKNKNKSQDKDESLLSIALDTVATPTVYRHVITSSLWMAAWMTLIP